MRVAVLFGKLLDLVQRNGGKCPNEVCLPRQGGPTGRVRHIKANPIGGRDLGQMAFWLAAAGEDAAHALAPDSADPDLLPATSNCSTDKVAVGGMPRSESWKKQLVAAGVPATPKKVDNSVKLSAGQRPPGQGLGGGIPCEVGIPCPDKPPPKPAFVAGNPDPWEPKPPKRVGRPDVVSTSIRTRAIAAATVSSVGTALAAALVAHNRRRRNFVAGGT